MTTALPYCSKCAQKNPRFGDSDQDSAQIEKNQIAKMSFVVIYFLDCFAKTLTLISLKILKKTSLLLFRQNSREIKKGARIYDIMSIVNQLAVTIRGKSTKNHGGLESTEIQGGTKSKIFILPFRIFQKKICHQNWKRVVNNIYLQKII